MVTDPKLLCQNYLKGKCNKGKDCKFHHNGPCAFHKKGNCNKGADCVFSHHDPPPQSANVVKPEAKGTAKPSAKAQAQPGDGKED